MPKIAYEQHRIQKSTAGFIYHADKIIRAYMKAGYKLTLRQLHYQFVSKNLYKNTTQNYNLLGTAVSTGRLLGLLDWDGIVDRLRELQQRPRWADPSTAVKSLADQYHIDIWKDQPERVEVWIEKDALSDIVENVCKPLGVDYMVCRGFASQSAMWEAGQRFAKYQKEGQQPMILYFGDHDPSGLDMPRDVCARINKFAATGHDNEIILERRALTMEQIEENNCPPNPAKLTDSRSAGYIAEHGEESWELDALSPEVLSKLIEDAIFDHVDAAKFERKAKQDDRERRELRLISKNYGDVVKHLTGKNDEEE